MTTSRYRPTTGEAGTPAAGDEHPSPAAPAERAVDEDPGDRARGDVRAERSGPDPEVPRRAGPARWNARAKL